LRDAFVTEIQDICLDRDVISYRYHFAGVLEYWSIGVLGVFQIGV